MKNTASLQRTVSPVDGSVYVERPLAGDRDIENALAQAVTAQAKWRQVPVAERAAIVRRMVEWCVARADVLGEELTRQMGRPIAYTPNEIRRGFQERALYMAGIAEAALADISITPGRRFIRRAPLGVVLVLAPWNYPWLTSVNAIVPALLAGNSV
ncbi:MAG TPA: aldehyde dehydrogenase family protein, partial [Burkholderiales bacterium]